MLGFWSAMAMFSREMKQPSRPLVICSLTLFVPCDGQRAAEHEAAEQHHRRQQLDQPDGAVDQYRLCRGRWFAGPELRGDTGLQVPQRQTHGEDAAEDQQEATEGMLIAGLTHSQQ